MKIKKVPRALKSTRAVRSLKVPVIIASVEAKIKEISQIDALAMEKLTFEVNPRETKKFCRNSHSVAAKCVGEGSTSPDTSKCVETDSYDSQSLYDIGLERLPDLLSSQGTVGACSTAESLGSQSALPANLSLVLEATPIPKSLCHTAPELFPKFFFYPKAL